MSAWAGTSPVYDFNQGGVIQPSGGFQSPGWATPGVAPIQGGLRERMMRERFGASPQTMQAVQGGGIEQAIARNAERAGMGNTRMPMAELQGPPVPIQALIQQMQRGMGQGMMQDRFNSPIYQMPQHGQQQAPPWGMYGGQGIGAQPVRSAAQQAVARQAMGMQGVGAQPIRQGMQPPAPQPQPQMRMRPGPGFGGGRF